MNVIVDDVIKEWEKEREEQIIGMANHILFTQSDIRENQKIAVLLNRTITKKNKKYLLIIGLDIVSRKVVKIIDSYGKTEELCSYNEDLAKYGRSSVIKVPCKLYDSPTTYNVLRLTGEVKYIGQTNFNKLYDKYDLIFYYESRYNNNNRIYNNFDVPEMMQILKRHPNKFFYFEVSVKSIVKEYVNHSGRKKLQIKILNCFADIVDTNTMWKNYVNKTYRGRVLVKAGIIHGQAQIKIYHGQVHNLDKHYFFDKQDIYQSIMYDQDYMTLDDQNYYKEHNDMSFYEEFYDDYCGKVYDPEEDRFYDAEQYFSDEWNEIDEQKALDEMDNGYYEDEDDYDE